jgi:hypothetical protein
MGWRTLSALLAFWIATALYPLFMVGVVAVGVVVLLLLTLRDHLLAAAAQLRDDEGHARTAPLLGGDSGAPRRDE